METLIVSAYPADRHHRKFRTNEKVKTKELEEEEEDDEKTPTPTEVEEEASEEETEVEATDQVPVFVKKCQVDVGYSPDFQFTRTKDHTSFYKRLNKKAEENRLELERSRTEATNGSCVTLEDKLKVLEDMMLTVTDEELRAVEIKMQREKEAKAGGGEEEMSENEGEKKLKSTILDKNGFGSTKNNFEGKGKNPMMLKRFKELLDENNSPKTWPDIKITSQKHPIDPSCYGNEVIRKIFYKKRPRRRVKVPFTRGSRLPHRLSREMYEQISQLPQESSQNDYKSSQNVGIMKQSSQNVGMILNIGRQRPLYHEQFEYLQSFENADYISADWAKLAACAVQTSPTASKVSRILIPVLCDKLVKLIECQDELKKFDKNVEYGMERLDVDGEEEEEDSKEVEEEKKVKRKSAISSVVKGVVAKLVDTVVADEEDLNIDKVVTQRRVGRELKRLNASLIEVEEEAASPPVDNAENNLAKVEKEYHQTVLKKKDKIIFVKGNSKRARRRPMKLADHVVDVGEVNEEEKATKRCRIDPAKEYKTDLIRQVEASVEHELSNPPIRDCSVKLVKAKLDQLQRPSTIVNNSDETSQKPSPIVNSPDETSQKPSPIVNNPDETFVEEICSLPKFNLKVPEHVTRPPLYKIGCANDEGPLKFKKRKIEVSEMVNSSPSSSIVRTKDLNSITLASLLKNADFPVVQQKHVSLNNESSHIAPGAQKRIKTLKPVLTPRNFDQQPAILSPDKDGSLKRIKTLQPVNVCSNSALPGAEKRIKTLLPVPAFQNRSTALSDGVAPVAKRLKSMEPEPEMTVKIESVISLSGDTINLFEENRKRNALVVPTKVRFKEIAGDFEKLTYDNKDVLSRSQYEFGIHILYRDSITEMVYMPHARDVKHNEDEYFGMYFYRGTPKTVMVGPFQMDEDPQILVHRGRNPVHVTLANKWCEGDDFVDTFWNCHNKVLMKHIVKYRNAFVYKTRKQQPKIISISRSSLNVSNMTLVDSTINCDKPEEGKAPLVELESTESSKVDVDPVEAGEKTQVRSLKKVEAESEAEPATTESTKSPDSDTVEKDVDCGETVNKCATDHECIDTENPATGDQEAEGKAESATTESTVSPDSDTVEMDVDCGEAANKCATDRECIDTENPATGDQAVNNKGERCDETPNKDAESTEDEVEEAKRESKSVTPICEQPALSDHLMEKEMQFFEYARKLNTLALNNVKLSFKKNEMNQSVKDSVELTSDAKKKKTVTFSDEVSIMIESPKNVEVNTELVKQNALSARKDVKIVRTIVLDKKKLVDPEVDEKNKAAEIDSHLIRKNTLSVCKDLEIVRKVDNEETKIENKNLVKAGVKDLDIIIRKVGNNEGTKIENKNLAESRVKDLDIIIRKIDNKGNIVSEVEKKGNVAEIDSHLEWNDNDLSVRKALEISRKVYSRIEIKNNNAVEARGRDFDIIIRNVDKEGNVVSEVHKKRKIDCHLVRKNALSVRKDLEIARKCDNNTIEIKNKNAVEAGGSDYDDLAIYEIDDKGKLVQDVVMKNAHLQKSKVDHTSNGKDTNSVEPKAIETIDLCESEPTVPSVTLTEPTEGDMNKKSATKKQPKVERKVYPSVGFRRIEPKPTTVFLNQGTSNKFFRVDNAKSILNHEKLQTTNSAEAVEGHSPVITTPIQAKNPATNQIIQVRKVIPTIQAKNPATNQIQATKVIQANSPNQVQVVHKYIEIPRILNPNAATKQSGGPQILQLCYQKSLLTDGQDKKIVIQKGIPSQLVGEKLVEQSKQNSPAKLTANAMPQMLQIGGKMFVQTHPQPSTSSLSATDIGPKIQSMLSLGNNKILITVGKTDSDKTVSLQNNRSVVMLPNSNQPTSSSPIKKKILRVETVPILNHSKTLEPTKNNNQQSVSQLSPFKIVLVSNTEKTSEPTKNCENPSNLPKGSTQPNLTTVSPLEASITNNDEKPSEPTEIPQKTTQQDKDELELIDALKTKPEYMMSYGLSFSNDEL